MSHAIESFVGEHRFLSNFFPVEIAYQGDVYPSIEHAYQAAKTSSKAERDKIREARTSGMAKRLGRRVTLRPDWEAVKLSIMHTLVFQKFANNKVLKAELLATGDSQLVEGNYWRDTFWGVYRGKGENHLGKILMKVRDQIKMW